MHTKQIEDLFYITQNIQYVMGLERSFFDTAKHLTDDYDGGQWESEKLVESWFFLLNTNKQFDIEGILINSKTFSYVVNYIVLVNMINILHDKGLEQDFLYSELCHILENLMNSIELILNEEERFQFYKLID